MTKNTELWDKLGKTDPVHTKTFKRAGGFSGTAIKPMWSYRRMTEEFGPCGQGWGINEPTFQVVPNPASEEILVYCTASVWYEKREQVVFGVGGDKVAGKNKYGAVTDDEAFKKAYTDAVTNALKMIGVGADVHMGMFDDNKYVNTMQREFAEAKTDTPSPVVKSSAQLKREQSWEGLSNELAQDMVDVRSIVSLNQVKDIYRKKAVELGWPKAWLAQLADEFEYYEKGIKASSEREQHVIEAGE